MNCQQCQATNEASSVFCSNCGSPLTRADEPRDSFAQAAAPSAPYQDGPRPQPPYQPTYRAEQPYQAQPPYQAQSQYQAQPPYQAQSPYQAPVGHRATHTTAPFSLDLRRLSQVERVVGVASIVVLISLFLPWFGFSAYGASFSLSGVSAHGYLYLALIVSLLVIAYLVVRSGWEQLPFTLPIAHGPLLLIGTGVQFLLVLIGFLDKLSGLSWDIGAYLALIAALVAAVPMIVPAVKSFQASR